MKLITKEVKQQMEECKQRALSAGLRFDSETLEYVVSNHDLVNLSPKIMIPTLYDYWVHDVDLLQGRGKYSIYPNNPYETVINTRPAISFYNDNNPDWLNVMIFYHVLGHIDFFQNNIFFENTWKDDFCGKALSDKILIDKIRREQGGDKRNVDYVIECARSIDNLVDYHGELGQTSGCRDMKLTGWVEYYFIGFIEKRYQKQPGKVEKEIVDYNELIDKHGEKNGSKIFLENVKQRFPEFQSKFKRYKKNISERSCDLFQHIMKNSTVFNRPKNAWMKEIVNIVRDTSLYFQPQIRTKIINEGWASFWHQRLFMDDERVSGSEVNYARVNSSVMSLPRYGLNPYAIGCLLFEFIYEMAEKGKFNYDFQCNLDRNFRQDYNQKTGNGLRMILWIRENFNDAMLINFLSSNDFQEFVTRNKLFVAGKRISETRDGLEIYVKSKKGEDYRQMLLNNLYHPPRITISGNKSKKDILFLRHHFEGKPLQIKYIRNVMFYLGYLWGDIVQLATTELRITERQRQEIARFGDDAIVVPRRVKVFYTMNNGEFTKKEAHI